jgi:hypothetical protein
MLREDKESFSLNQLWVISGPTKYPPKSSIVNSFTAGRPERW